MRVKQKKTKNNKPSDKTIKMQDKILYCILKKEAKKAKKQVEKEEKNF